MQNGVGLVAAGGLGGWVYLQNGTRQKEAAEQEADKAEQRAKIDSLSSQVGSAVSVASAGGIALPCFLEARYLIILSHSKFQSLAAQRL